MWGGGGGGGELCTCHCHHQNDSCIKMGSDESQFKVSLIVRVKVTRQCPKTITFRRERRAEEDSNRGPSAYQPNALPLGQTGSLEQRHRASCHLCTHEHTGLPLPCPTCVKTKTQGLSTEELPCQTHVSQLVS